MARNKRRRSKKQSPPWLVFSAVGGVLAIIAAVILLTRGGDEKDLGTSTIDPSVRPTVSPVPQSLVEFDPSFTPEVAGAPRVEIPQANVDHGNVRLGDTIQTVFNVRNVGDQPLTISSAQVEVVEGC
jgi:hypothetical protein